MKLLLGSIETIEMIMKMYHYEDDHNVIIITAQSGYLKKKYLTKSTQIYFPILYFQFQCYTF